MEKATRFPPNELLKAQRLRHFWTQEQLAEKIGTTDKNVGRWERGDTSPSLYYCQRLCEVFHLSACELGLISEGAELHSSPPETFPPKTIPRSVALAALVLVVVIVGYIALSWYLATPMPAHAHIEPGGSWISPLNGQTVHDVVDFAAFAYPTHSGDPQIDHVNFTVWWQGVDPRTWIIACAVHAPTTKDVYKCDVNLAQLGAPAGQIKISFDVYDQNGNSNQAPNGEHLVIYTPAPVGK